MDQIEKNLINIMDEIEFVAKLTDISIPIAQQFSLNFSNCENELRPEPLCVQEGNFKP